MIVKAKEEQIKWNKLFRYVNKIRKKKRKKYFMKKEPMQYDIMFPSY